MHGLDRPTQLLFARAIASGRAAEMIADKPELVETDRFFRRAGLYLHLTREVSRLDDQAFGDLTMYCEGVNDGLKQAGRSFPMWATGFRPQPWDQRAVILMGNLLSYAGLSLGQQQHERTLLELIQLGVDPAKLREMFAPILDDVDFELLKQVKTAAWLSDEALELIVDLPRLIGSNAWAISPKRSATGSPLLAADPHLEVNRLPAVWYEAVLEWPQNYVLGATLPGCPLVAVGRTAHLAWGVTHMKGDLIDDFIEDCRPGGATGWQYRRDSTWHDFHVREEAIMRKGAPTEILRIYENALGTMESDPTEAGPGLYLSSAWIGHEEGSGHAMSVWVRLPRCASVTEAMDLVRDCPQPSLCWVLADRTGHIGLQGSGWFPKRRRGHNGATPVPAWDTQNHWQGWIESYLLPRLYDPPEGHIATANENVNPPGGPMLLTLPVPEHRKRRIEERLSQLKTVSMADMQALQYDVMSVQARELLDVFLPHLADGPIKTRLAAWDCRYTPHSREATLFMALYRNVLVEVFGHEAGIGWRRMLHLCSRSGYSTMVLTAADRVLVNESSLWWAGRDKGDLIRRAAHRAQREPDQPWAKTNAFRFTNRFFERRAGRILGFHTGELPMIGCHATPFQGHLLRTAKRESTFAPSYHFTTDVGADEAWTNLPGGPSESRFSPYYKTDIPLWLDGRYKRLAPTRTQA
jgi:penicillin amidase